MSKQVIDMIATGANIKRLMKERNLKPSGIKEEFGFEKNDTRGLAKQG